MTHHNCLMNAPALCLIPPLALAGAYLAVSTAQADTIFVDDDTCLAVYHPAGDGPHSVAIGDLDGVSGPDLAVANQISDDVSVLLNQGDGTFSVAVSYNAGDEPWSVAIGDLDGINGPDLAVANSASGDVSVLLNQGDGTFAAAVPYAVGDLPRSVAIGDLDGINGPDLAVATASGAGVLVLLNQGDGTFAAAVAYAAGGWSVAIGDLDGVNGPDLAVMAGFSGVKVLLNLGDGTFAAAVAYSTGDGPGSVAIGDLDGVDGPDLVVANAWSDDVSVLLNLGDGTFAAAVSFQSGVYPFSVAIGDLDGVNGLDLVVANVVSDDIWLLPNLGDGTFAAAAAYPAGDEPWSVAIGDLDGINGPDLAVANYSSDDASVLLNLGDGTFLGSGTATDPYCLIQSAIDAAVDGDEIVVAPGTYFETIDFLGKAITLRSSDGPDVTIVSANGSYLWDVAITCQSGEGSDTRLDGFTITDSSASCTLGAMTNFSSSPTVTNCRFVSNSASGMSNFDGSGPTVIACTFKGNQAAEECCDDCTPASFGGGMYNSSGSPTVIDCQFLSNHASFGGGMYNGSGNPTVDNCTFSDNTAMFASSPGGPRGEGGAIYNVGGTPTMTNCTFSGNSANRRGGGMSNDNSNSTVTDCTFDRNTSDQHGGGMSNYVSSTTVTNCTFRGNSADDSGGGMYNTQSSSPTVVNCTFSGNSAMNGYALAFDSFSTPSELIMANCILWDGSDEIWNNDESTLAITYSNLQGGWPGTGNIDADPLFIDPSNGALWLQTGSPCIDAGHNNAIADLADTDVGGNARFADDPATADTGCGTPVVVDMGAYEYQGEPAAVHFGDVNGDGHVSIMDLVALNACMGSSDPDCCVADLDLDGQVGIFDALLLIPKLIDNAPMAP